jgi:DNA-binding transcriptional ArsR family regulator
LANGVGSPVRARIVRLLREHGELSPTGAATELDGVPLGTVACHFRHLREHGLIELCDTIPRRGTVGLELRLAFGLARAGDPLRGGRDRHALAGRGRRGCRVRWRRLCWSRDLFPLGPGVTPDMM